jgi:FAD:protein FMN transferase
MPANPSLFATLTRYAQLVLLSFFLLGCKEPQHSNVTEFQGIAMTIPYRIVIGRELNQQEISHVQKILNQTFDEINAIYNKWNPKSEISRLNKAKGHISIPLSSELHRFLIETGTYVELTKGKFDPAIEPIQQLWKQSLEKGALPSQNDLESCASCCGWDKLHFEDHTLWKEHSMTSIDLGGIAKGYAIDLIGNRLYSDGFLNLYVEWGGEILAKGHHPDKRPWRVMITKWGVPGDGNTVVELHDEAIASSGDYLQNWKLGDKTYSHIFDPTQGKPLEITARSICSVTIVAPTCTIADTLATTAMLFESPEESINWLAEIKRLYPDISYWVYSRSNSALQN